MKLLPLNLPPASNASEPDRNAHDHTAAKGRYMAKARVSGVQMLLVVSGIALAANECLAVVELTASSVSLSVSVSEPRRTFTALASSNAGESVRVEDGLLDTQWYPGWQPYATYNTGAIEQYNSYAQVNTVTYSGNYVDTRYSVETFTTGRIGRGSLWLPPPHGAVQVYSPFVNQASPFPTMADGDGFIYRVGNIYFRGESRTGGSVYILNQNYLYNATLQASFRVSGDQPMSRVFATQLGAPTPSGELVVRDSGLLNRTESHSDTLTAEGASGNANPSWTHEYYVYAVVPLPSVTINVTSGTQTQAQAGYPTLINAPVVTKTGLGTLVMDNANPYTGTTTVSEGTLTITNPLAVQASPLIVRGGGVIQLPKNTPIVVPAKTIECDVASGGKIDVGRSVFICLPPNGAGDGWMVDWISGGWDGGSWQGAGGITSSAVIDDAANGTSRAVGWMENGDGSVTFGYAAAGDTNLDWQIDVLDAANFLAGGKFDTGLPANWSEGDFNYDAMVDLLDGAEFVASGLFDAGPYNTPAGTIAAVPEPATPTMALAGAACGGYLMWRRRKLA